MTSPPRRTEAASVSSTFHVAMAMLGGEVFAEVLELWDDVVPTTARLSATSAKFYLRALGVTRLRRHQVQAIVIPYLRLARALHTGSTFQPIFAGEPTNVTLAKLRFDFYRAVEKYAPDALTTGDIPDRYTKDDADDSTTVKEPDGSPYTPYDPSKWKHDDPVEVEPIDGLSELLDELEAIMEAEAEVILKDLGQEMMERRLADLQEEAARVADRLREEAHGKVGRRLAAHAERLVQNGGRHAEEAIAQVDIRVIGYARKHYPENDIHPCSFCAMLLSRGAVYKKGTVTKRDKSKRAHRATWEMWSKSFDIPTAAMDQYHPLCHCRGEAVYSNEQFNEDPGFQVNRDLQKLWQDNIAGKYSAKGAETAWRALLKPLRRAGQEPAKERPE